MERPEERLDFEDDRPDFDDFDECPDEDTLDDERDDFRDDDTFDLDEWPRERLDVERLELFELDVVNRADGDFETVGFLTVERL